ncbi:hypothetical protein CAOG_02204 [Capsaspora owczarzaki ATCC 30864]|uniref:Methyltransferase type 12 domain-containing protein n=1 Tax=Capsaspora owczarzaki (strain ATCC 30864) TaxID=595528 RepID=A0A0D2X1L0_CAPO3|nr:hypothetical protein CAOG_02204 [Capsaspora owczarzaki ATCC 30864]KJE90994.1 hypothetical protein CAOG_002204 [Capsaspora owczarzaki ATCC 30864]|eukprot:XP_004348954.2 hypothetical protein CAOG_02204 [Capsaspora owczarzaki ATCC 30864]
MDQPSAATSTTTTATAPNPLPASHSTSTFSSQAEPLTERPTQKRPMEHDESNPDAAPADTSDEQQAAKRTRFGTRYLEDESQVFEQNAWDNVEWDPEQIEYAKKVVREQALTMVSEADRERYEAEAGEFWNKFYSQHDTKFFKDRNWLFTEFPELMPSENSTDSYHIFEPGCGVGNTVLPILQTNRNPNLRVYAADFSARAVELLKETPLFQAEQARCQAFVHDITSTDPYPIPEGSLDVIIIIFVLSAVDPSKMQDAMTRLARLLKPGGALLLRDYGRHDLTQLRFKKNKMLSDNFYVRGDGTRVYFFSQDDLDSMLTKAGLVKEFNRPDNRLIVNRAKQIKMYRVWLQVKYVKPFADGSLPAPLVSTAVVPPATSSPASGSGSKSAEMDE